MCVKWSESQLKWESLNEQICSQDLTFSSEGRHFVSLENLLRFFPLGRLLSILEVSLLFLLGLEVRAKTHRFIKIVTCRPF